jgi:hypothetical protein
VLKQDNTTPGIALDTRDALVVFTGVSGSGKSFPPAVAPEAKPRRTWPPLSILQLSNWIGD